MEWINRKDQEPDLKLKCILIWNHIKDEPLVVSCYGESTWWIPSVLSNFKFWCLIPQKPDETTPKPKEESNSAIDDLNSIKRHMAIRNMSYEDAMQKLPDILIDFEKRLRKLEGWREI